MSPFSERPEELSLLQNTINIHTYIKLVTESLQESQEQQLPPEGEL